MSVLRRQGICCVVFIDYCTRVHHIVEMFGALHAESAGNSRCMMTPSQKIIFLGFIMDSLVMTLHVENSSSSSCEFGVVLLSPPDLESMAGAFAVKTFTRERENLHVWLMMDNTTAVAYLNHMGGTRSPSLVKQLNSPLSRTPHRHGQHDCRLSVPIISEWRLDPGVSHSG